MKLVCIATFFFGLEASSIDEMAAVLQTKGSLIDMDAMVVASFDEKTRQFPHGWSNGAKPHWFDITRSSIQSRADNLHHGINQCRVLENPKLGTQQEIRDDHVICRGEQASLLTLNTTQECNDDKKRDCDRLQGLLEDESCELYYSHNDHCDRRVTCYESAVNEYEVEMAAIREQVFFLKAEFVHYKKIECRFRSWPLTAATKIQCADLIPDTSHLDITYPDQPEALTACHSAPSKPGDDAWIAAEYNNSTWTAHVLATPNCSADFSRLPKVNYTVVASTFYRYHTAGVFGSYAAECLMDGVVESGVGANVGLNGCEMGHFLFADHGVRGGTIDFSLDSNSSAVRFVVYNLRNSGALKEIMIERGIGSSQTGYTWVEVKSVSLAHYPLVARQPPQNLDVEVEAANASKHWRFKVVSSWAADGGVGGMGGLMEVEIKAQI